MLGVSSFNPLNNISGFSKWYFIVLLDKLGIKISVADPVHFFSDPDLDLQIRKRKEKDQIRTATLIKIQTKNNLRDNFQS